MREAPSAAGRITFPESDASSCVRNPERGLKHDMVQLMRDNTRLRGENFALRMEIARLKTEIGGDRA